MASPAAPLSVESVSVDPAYESSLRSVVYVGTTMRLLVNGLSAGGVYQGNATVTLESLTDAAGNEVSGLAYPSTFVHVSASPEGGDYRLTLPAALAIQVDRLYTASIRCVSADGAATVITESILGAERRA